MIKKIIVFLLAGTWFFNGPLCRADVFLNDLFFQDPHTQAVNQALDKAEAGICKVNAKAINHTLPDRNEFGINPEIYWAKFDEPNSFSQKGFMSGYDGFYSHRFSRNTRSVINMFSLQSQWASGKFKQDPGVGPSGIKDNTFDIRGVVGRDIYPSARLRLTPFTGFGYRYLKDNSQGLNTFIDDYELFGYQRYSHYVYLPFGAQIIYQPYPNYSLESVFEYDYMFNGWQVSKLGVLPGYSTLVVDQKDGTGLRASLRLNLYFKYCTAFAEGFVRYWSLPQSKSKPDPTDPAYSLFEPKNNTQEYGLRLGLLI